jgi:putative hydrolase of HD superfamily
VGEVQATRIELPPAVEALLRLEELKVVERQNPLACADRLEGVAEHSWHLALAVPLLAPFSPVLLDISKATLLAVVHDIAEAFVGDTFAYGNQVATQYAREHAAIDKFVEENSDKSVKFLVSLWLEYEMHETPEARFVKGLDAFLPILLNHSNSQASSWVRHGVWAHQVQSRLGKVRTYIGELSHLSDQMIHDAIAQGHLRI